jgi:multidrug resistance protein MdtO
MRQKSVDRLGASSIAFATTPNPRAYPNMDSISSLVVLVSAIAMLSAWVLPCPRISYVRVRIGFAFFLTALPGFRATTLIAPVRDRVIGATLGILVMWFIFDQLWPTRTSHALERVLLSIGKATRELSAARKSISGRLEKSGFQRLRAGVSLELTNLQQLEFAAHFETGRQRKRELARSRRLIRQIESSAAEFYRLARQVSAD